LVFLHLKKLQKLFRTSRLELHAEDWD
jgi:hypothetical protein